MAPAAATALALSGEQVQLLCHTAAYCKPDNAAWNAIGAKMNISGSAAQQRFGRLLQKLKAADASGGPKGSMTPLGKPQIANKKNAQKGGKGRQPIQEEEEESEGSESPSKKRATVKNGIKREKVITNVSSDSDDGAVKEGLRIAANSVKADLDESD